MTKTTLTHDRLRELLSYEPETGIFRWKVCRNSRNGRTQIGSIAGGMNHDGYRHIRLDGYLYQSHRLAWFYVHGFWPPQTVDHIDRNPSNNALSNLRLASQWENLQNRGRAPEDIGAYRSGNTWYSHFYRNGQHRYLGSFPSKEEARAAYEKAHAAYSE